MTIKFVTNFDGIDMIGWLFHYFKRKDFSTNGEYKKLATCNQSLPMIMYVSIGCPDVSKFLFDFSFLLFLMANQKHKNTSKYLCEISLSLNFGPF